MIHETVLLKYLDSLIAELKQDYGTVPRGMGKIENTDRQSQIMKRINLIKRIRNAVESGELSG
jgi:hypothetical protein